jgi:uncharacterized RDD family membrane protein YckC
VQQASAAVVFPTIRRRLAGMLYESLLLIGVLAATFMVPQIVLGMAAGIALPGPVLGLHVFVVLGAYFLWYWRHGGSTLAMQTWKLRIRAANGAEPTLRQLALRYVVAWPSILLCGIGILWALVDPDRQFLHDRLAGTRIVFR